MNVTVEVVGEGSHDLEVEDATYADLLAAVDLSPHEVSVLVDGRPVPEDEPVDADHVKVLRLIKGGAGEDSDLASDGTETDPVAGFESVSERLGISRLDFELPNAGTGPDPLSLADFAADPDTDAVVVFFQRDDRCRNCRRQVRDVADRYSEFRARDATVVSVLPESKATAEEWQARYHLPFALVADADKTVAEAYGQPTRFGKLGAVSDLLGRLPQVVVLDARDGLEPDAVYRGDAPSDRPSVDDVLAMVDRLLADEE